MASYLFCSLAWSAVWFVLGCLCTYIYMTLEHPGKKDDDHS